MTYRQIIEYWFSEISPELWWRQSTDFDQQLRDRFGDVHKQAAASELFEWRAEPLGRLAEIIVLDQFSRNIYRGSAKAFEQDSLALALAQEAVESDVGQYLSAAQLPFLYMPYMHSESRKIHEVAVILFSAAGMDSNLAFELRHKAIIDRFGRYPHRNVVLGRTSTDDEVEFLKTPGSSF